MSKPQLYIVSQEQLDTFIKAVREAFKEPSTINEILAINAAVELGNIALTKDQVRLLIWGSDV